MKIPLDRTTPDNFFWMNKPDFTFSNEKLTVTTSDETDFWQRTHYGFSRDNGHAMLSSIPGNFRITVKTVFNYINQYDQCGIFLRIDGLNWIKVAAEREDSEHCRLGSVITNLGYSDWATSDIDPQIMEMWYRVECRDNDFLIDSSPDGTIWTQMRIAHLHSRQRPLNAGIFACSPKTGSFIAEFSELSIEQKKES
ncbi:MAG: DUF1349 domain-containing protein [Spirochaetes bacterium]|nr:MAG: DUF1349 domain-containing protein [Spirochaetota bacterium]RKX98339.1 MAG: DUF1349 domain-containing protein [Spirochaetota bacterium]